MSKSIYYEHSYDRTQVDLPPITKLAKSLKRCLLTLSCLFILFELTAPMSVSAAGVQDSRATSNQQNNVTAFVDVTLIPMTEDANVATLTRENQTVIVTGDRITAVGSADEVEVPQGAMVIDGTGAYLLPGLVDMHVHMYFDENFDLRELNPLYLKYGVTSVLSMNGNDEMLRMRAQSRGQELLWPTIYTTSPYLDPPTYSTPDEVENAVIEFTQAGYDLIKVHENHTPAAFERLMATAQQEGIRVIGHAQRHREIQATLDQKMDLAHMEEYMYAYFNPTTPILKAFLGSGLGLVLLLVTIVGWGCLALWHRIRGNRPAYPIALTKAKQWVIIFTLFAWSFFLGFILFVSPPLGMFAGMDAPRFILAIVMIGVSISTALLGWHIFKLWPIATIRPWPKAYLTIIGVGAIIFVLMGATLIPRSWRTTPAGLERIAQATADSGIWVNAGMITYDYLGRANAADLSEFEQQEIMRYLKKDEQIFWTSGGDTRGSEFLAPLAHQGLKRQLTLINEMVGMMHRKGVPFLAGTDVSIVGVQPGYALHEELALFVAAGLTPYEALQIATVNPAKYLGEEDEFGAIVEGLRADLILVKGNPLDDIGQLGERVGVMARGRWISAEVAEHLDELAGRSVGP